MSLPVINTGTFKVRNAKDIVEHAWKGKKLLGIAMLQYMVIQRFKEAQVNNESLTVNFYGTELIETLLNSKPIWCYLYSGHMCFI